MQELTIFNFENNNIRSLSINNAPWFVGKDVANALGYTNSRKAISDHVDEEDKGVTKCYTLKGAQKLTIINESGLYALIFGSKLESAKKFKRWVTNEVLPQIRKTGSYNANDKDERLELAKIISKASIEALLYIRELYPNYFNSLPGSFLELESDENTSYQKWIEEYCIDVNYISEFPTLDLFNNYVRFCLERRYTHKGKKTFYKTLEWDFGLVRVQKTDGKRYFLKSKNDIR